MLHLFKDDMLLHCYIIYLIENIVIFGINFYVHLFFDVFYYIFHILCILVNKI